MSFGGGSGSSSIAGSTDVVLNSPANNQVLGYNSGTAKWQNQTKTLGPCCTSDPRSLKATVTTFPAANRTYFMRVQGEVAGATAYLIWVGTASGNISIANYANTGTGINAAPTGSPRGVTGSVACPATGAQLVFASGGAFNVAEGDWIGLSCDNGTASFGSGMDGAPTELYAGLCCANNVFPAGTPSSPYTATKPFFVAAEYAAGGGGGGGSPAWRGDYQTSFLTGYEPYPQYNRSAQQAIVTTPARSGYTNTARYIVAPGDTWGGVGGTERSEVYTSQADSGYPVNGQTMWWAWSMYLPSGFHVDSDVESPVGNGWIVLTQWHCESGTGGGGLGVMFGLTKGTATPHIYLDATSSEWVDPSPLPLGVWNDFVMGITWGDSDHAGVGHVVFRLNGTTKVDAAANTLQVGQWAYFKQGIYRSSSNQTHTVYYTGTRRGTTEASVAL